MLKVPVLLGLWLCVIFSGYSYVVAYDNKPAFLAAAPISEVRRTTEQARLVVFLHPLCPCSKATVEQVRELLAKAPNLRVTMYLSHPKDSPKEFLSTSLVHPLQDHPRVSVRVDENCTAALAAKAQTSGETYLYSADGKLRYHGGITRSRGHQGDCDMFQKVLSLAKNEIADLPPSSGPVFGCSLY